MSFVFVRHFQPVSQGRHKPRTVSDEEYKTQKPTQRRVIFWRCTIFRLAKPAFLRYFFFMYVAYLELGTKKLPRVDNTIDQPPGHKCSQKIISTCNFFFLALHYLYFIQMLKITTRVYVIYVLSSKFPSKWIKKFGRQLMCQHVLQLGPHFGKTFEKKQRLWRS